jgi:hypothetical protein
MVRLYSSVMWVMTTSIRLMWNYLSLNLPQHKGILGDHPGPPIFLAVSASPAPTSCKVHIKISSPSGKMPIPTSPS